MRRAIAGIAVLVATMGPAFASAGTPRPDDENDYEGRVEKSNDTYFGFDLNKNKTKASGFTAYLNYVCPDTPAGESLIEVSEDSLAVKNGKFDGVVKQKQKIQQTGQRGGPPRSVEFVFDIKNGELENGGKASGKIEAAVILRYEGGGKQNCKATNDGKWKATKGKDIDAPTPEGPLRPE